MSPKGRGNKDGKGADAKTELECRSVLQAVLLADSFQSAFRPLTIEAPAVLLPLANTPLIEYTLEWLAMSKVEEVYVFCCAHAEQITAYLAASKWAHSKEMQVVPVVSTSCFSAGEALRLIDQKDIIKNDFVLISGDTVCNINLAPYVEAHRARRQADKNAIFTMLAKATQHPLQRLRMGGREAVMCLDAGTGRLLKFHEPQAAGEGQEGGEGGRQPTLPPLFKLDAALFGERDCLKVRTDLMDTHIAICAPEVLMLFSDNFDYQTVKPDFVTGVLSEEELGNKLYVAELGRAEYAGCVRNLRAYDAVSRDVMQRWVFPLVPDTHLLWRGGAWGASTYRYARGNRYFEQQVSIHRTAHMGEDVVVGAGTSIGGGCKVEQSVVGRNCRIGKGVEMLGCYIMDDAMVQDGAVLRYAIVSGSAVVGAQAVLGAGAVVGRGVVIGRGHCVAPYARVSLCQQVQQQVSLSDDEGEFAGAAAVGRMGKGQAKQQQRQQQARQRQQQRGGGGEGSSSSSGSGSSGEGSEGGESSRRASSSGSEADVLILSAGPSAAATSAAQSLAMGRDPDAATLAAAAFDEGAVGKGGAGYAWRMGEGAEAAWRLLSVAPPPFRGLPDEEDEEEVGVCETASASGAKGAADTESEEGEEEVLDPESNFKREVSETFLRCVKLRFDQTNAVIELNGLKIAEDRTFADCARYIFTTLLAMCGPAPAWVKDEYAPLFLPRGSPPPARGALLSAFRKHLAEWAPLLQRFLRSEDDQVEVLLTFEEYCSEEGVFEGQGEHGKAFAEIFEPMLKVIYDAEVVSEEAILAWADEKELAEEEEKQLVKKAQKFIEWLRASDEESSREGEEESD